MIKEQLKESLTTEEIIDIVCYLGSDPPKRNIKGDLIFQTICHNPKGEGSYKLYYYDNTKLFSCYTECGKSFDIFELIEKVKSISFIEAVSFVQEYTGKRPVIPDFSSDTKIDDWKFIHAYNQERRKKEVELQIYNSTLLDLFQKKYHQSWIKEGISINSMQKFNILFDSFDNKIIIPHYDLKNNLIGIRSRNLNKDLIEAGMKYMPVKIEDKIYAHPLSYNLYGLNHNLSYIKRLKKIIIFEGEKSVLKMESYYPNQNFSAAVCGDKISEYQKKMIIEYAEEVIIAFDKGEEYKKGNKHKSIIRIRDIAKRFAPYINTYILVDKNNLLNIKDAPVDQGKGVLEHLLKNKISVKTFLS